MEKPAKRAFTTVGEYNSMFPGTVRDKLEELRYTIRAAAPGAEEVISYGMPAFRQHGVLVYYAACKEHIGFYPTASGISSFTKELAKYRTTKGSIHFPLDKPVPVALVRKIVKFRVREEADKAAARIAVKDAAKNAAKVAAKPKPKR